MNQNVFRRRLWSQIMIYVFTVSSWALIVTVAFRIRPLQDDYLVLSAISESSIKQFLTSIWNFQGGNLFPYILNAILLSPAKFDTNFIGLTFFYLATVSLAGMTGVLILKMLTGMRIKDIGWKSFFLVTTLITVSFEGIFVPSFIGAFSFSLASFAHLWPIMLITFSIYLFLHNPSYFPLALILGLVIGNSNAAESFSSFIISLFLVIHSIQSKKTQKFQTRFSIMLFVGIALGILAMVSAPGFENRAINSVGFPASADEFIYRFLKASVSFPADFLSHPGAYVALFVGLIYKQFIKIPFDILIFRKNFFFLCGGALLLIVSLIGGGTLAYTSWHQALGLHVLLVPIFFGAGVLISSRIGPKLTARVPLILASLLILTSFTSIRAAHAVNERAQIWDSTLVNNICLIQVGELHNLTGAEIRYPPLWLGVEDVQSWEWMKTGYVSWIRNLPEYKSTKC